MIKLTSLAETILPPGDAGNMRLEVSQDLQLGSTKLTTDTNTVVSRMPNRVNRLKSIIESVHQPGAEDIIAFLKKPFRLKTGTFTTTDAGTLQTAFLPNDIFTNAYQAEKLNNVFMTRCDVVLTLNVNATQFQSGRYILALIPSGGAVLSTISPWYIMHNANLTTVTQCPNLQIDLSQETQVKLVFPFMSTTTHVPNVSAISSSTMTGMMALVTYSPLAVGATGPTTCDYTIWAALDNIELSGASYQSGNTTREQEDLGVAPLSTALAKVSTASGIIAELPLLAEIAMPVSWVADVLSRSVASLGLSRPIVLSAPNRVDRKPNIYTNNSDGAIPAVPMGVMSTNEVQIGTGVAATDIDEMSLDFIKTRFAYWSTITWTTGSAVGFGLLNAEHNPYNYFTSISPAVVFTPVCWLSRSFKYWRGSLKFRFKLVKTQFHSGRLVVAYSPHDYRVSAPANNIDLSAVLVREVIDIRQTSEFEVCVPYCSQDPYRFSGTSNGVGALQIFVLDRLIAPETVPTSIKILVEVCGGDDFQVAVPLEDARWNIYSPAAAQSGSNRPENEFSLCFPESQSGYKSIGCHDLGNTMQTVDVDAVCIGERVSSVRQIMKRMSMVEPVAGYRNYTLPASTAADFNIFNPYIITPFKYASAILTNKGIFHPDVFAKWSVLYAMSSGGVIMNLKFLNTSVNYNIIIDVSDTMATDVQTVVAAGGALPPRGSSYYMHISSVEGNDVNLQTPAYCRGLARATPAMLSGSSFAQADNLGKSCGVQYWVTPEISSATVTQYAWSRAVADDFCLSGWCGTVPVVVHTIT